MWMARRLVALVGCLALFGNSVLAQNSNRAQASRAIKKPFLGLFLTAVPDVLYTHFPKLKRSSGILVEKVKADSPGDRAGLKRHDILLSYNGKTIKSSEHFITLVRSDDGFRKVPVRLLRRGKEITLGVNLVRWRRLADKKPNTVAKGFAKNGLPPRVSVEATMLGGGKLEVSFEFLVEGKGKLRKVTFSGSLDEIATQVRKLPMPVRDLAQVALTRLRNRKYK
jgi:hypothetical protein